MNHILDSLTVQWSSKKIGYCSKNFQGRSQIKGKRPVDECISAPLDALERLVIWMNWHYAVGVCKIQFHQESPTSQMRDYVNHVVYRCIL